MTNPPAGDLEVEDRFFDRPILNSPYKPPSKHWELDGDGQPTQRVIESRRSADFITPIPKPRRRRKGESQQQLVLDEGRGLSTSDQQYEVAARINEVRRHVDQWRSLPNPNDWGVTPETARLLQHWRRQEVSGIRPFFCQVEAVETLIWLTEVAPRLGEVGKRLLDTLADASTEANPGLERLALKMATGAGKTTVMAMIIAWQTVNAVRRPNSRRFTRGFLVMAPGITIKDRLRVLRPNDPDSYFANRDLVPGDMLGDLGRAQIVISNYHALRLRDRMEVSSGGRALLQGRGSSLNSIETEGQMVQRVMHHLMGVKNIWVLNDEGHHCYRHKPGDDEEGALRGDDRKEAEKNSEAARVWISGLEAVKHKLGIARVVDLSATPFFLRGSGYREGTLFPWTVSDFSLMDAIESGIVKLPRVPVSDNSIPSGEMPKYRDLWKNIRRDMPKGGRGKTKGELDPLSLPGQLETALQALYGHYEETYQTWNEGPPPCFVVVCNNTSTSKLVYDYISGFHRENDEGSQDFRQGHLPLFQNFDEHGNPFPIPRTVLIDSEQLESGDALDKSFRSMAADEIERFRREKMARTGDVREAEKITDQDLLREVMNTVGKEGRLGQSVRCVVSVSMLTEGWDASTVTHILGVRAFGTQLLCEQVVGRALRRQSYELNECRLFDVEYADVLGVPFNFTAKPVVAKRQPHRETVHVHAVRPDRDDLEIRFPRVSGYRVDPPKEELVAQFTPDSYLELTPELTGPTKTRVEGIIGEGIDLDVEHLRDERPASVAFYLAKHLLETRWRDPNEAPKLHLFGKLKGIVRQWLDGYLVCKGGAYPAQLMYRSLADRACEIIMAAITTSSVNGHPVKVLLDPFNPAGFTGHVNFNTSKTDRWKTNHRKSHVNWVILDGGWEAEFCRVAEAHPRVKAYVKNENLGLEVPYRSGSYTRTYIPDFILLVDDGRGEDDLLNLVVEIKGFRNQDARMKKLTMDTYWVPGVNALGDYGRWAFEEFTDAYEIEDGFDALMRKVITESSIPDYSALSTKELLASSPIDEKYLARPREFPRDIDFDVSP